MNFTRRALSNDKIIQQKNITRIWGNDGWCYIPELRIRQKFNTLYVYEKRDGVFAMPEYVDKVEWKLLSHNPRTWAEGNDVFCVINRVR